MIHLLQQGHLSSAITDIFTVPIRHPQHRFVITNTIKWNTLWFHSNDTMILTLFGYRAAKKLFYNK